MTKARLMELLLSKWKFKTKPYIDAHSKSMIVQCDKEQVPLVCDWLFNQEKYHFAGLIAQEKKLWELCYLFVGSKEIGYIKIITTSALQDPNFTSVSTLVHATDWHEREAEDLFGINFEGHPRLGDFILHDDIWQEGVKPMSSTFDKKAALNNLKPKLDWQPRRVLDLKGAFIMPIGPVFSGEAESLNIQLETVGEEIIRAFPRLFFKYRGVEKIAVGRRVKDVILLAERNAGTSAFSHALAYSLAIESSSDIKVPKRAQMLRIFFAEMERIRSHISTIEAICNSTGLVVAASQVAILEEEMLRLSGELSVHRYFFGLCVIGGLSKDCDEKSCQKAIGKIKNIILRLDEIKDLLINTSSFLDRLEEVGVINKSEAKTHDLVGPMARGSNYCNDLRKFQPYLGYDKLDFEPSCEIEGDGYARLRVLFDEVKTSAKIMEQVISKMPKGEIFAKGDIKASTALAGVETPRGAAWHWIEIDENERVKRYRMLTPSFTNWHGFHLAIENFAFQDLPIIMATLGQSVAENDR